MTRKYLLILGAVFFLSSLGEMVRLSTQRADIWWTPKELALPLGAAADRVQLTIAGAPLPEVLAAGRLQLVTDTGTRPVTDADVRLRLNNRDRVRVQQTPALVSTGIGLGVALVILLAGVLGWEPGVAKAAVRDQTA